MFRNGMSTSCARPAYFRNITGSIEERKTGDMGNRAERRRAEAQARKTRAKLEKASLEEHFNDALRRIRAELVHTGEVRTRFECVSPDGLFVIKELWHNAAEKRAAYGVLRDAFRRRGVSRYIFTAEGRVTGTEEFNLVTVFAVERGRRKFAKADIIRDEARTTLGPWEIDDHAGEGWLTELLEEGHSDRPPKVEEPTLPHFTASDLRDIADGTRGAQRSCGTGTRFTSA
jgi:hypothetical protein